MQALLHIHISAREAGCILLVPWSWYQVENRPCQPATRIPTKHDARHLSTYFPNIHIWNEKSHPYNKLSVQSFTICQPQLSPVLPKRLHYYLHRPVPLNYPNTHPYSKPLALLQHIRNFPITSTHNSFILHSHSVILLKTQYTYPNCVIRPLLIPEPSPHLKLFFITLRYYILPSLPPMLNPHYIRAASPSAATSTFESATQNAHN